LTFSESIYPFKTEEVHNPTGTISRQGGAVNKRRALLLARLE
jgi:hypothetical protein